MIEIDDSALLHGAVYDPAKARAYYLRTRHLKGRQSGSGEQTTGRTLSDSSASSSEARRAKLEAEKAALTKRLERLKEVLKELVAAAKARSGVETPKDTKSKDSATKDDSKKKDEPLTSKQKHDKAAAAKKQYQKDHPSSPAKDLEALKSQIKDIRAKIEQAIADAQTKSSGHKVKDQPLTASKGR